MVTFSIIWDFKSINWHESIAPSREIKGVNANDFINVLRVVYSCESEPPIVGKVSHMWISEKR